MNAKTLYTSVLLAFFLVFGGPSSVQAASFTFTKIADTSTPIPDAAGTFTSFRFGAPSIDNGDVVFVGRGTLGLNGIYLFSDGALSVIADSNTLIPGYDRTFAFFANFSLDNGNVAFGAMDASGQEGIYASLDDLLQVVADTNTPLPDGGIGNFSGFNLDGSAPSLEASNVAFSGGGANLRGKFLFSDGLLETVVSNTTPAPDGIGNFSGSSSGGPSLNGNRIAFWNVNAISQEGIYLYDEGVITVLVDEGTPIPEGIGSFTSLSPGSGFPSLDGDKVAFWGAGDLGQEGVYVVNLDGIVEVVANLDTPVPDGIGNFIDFGYSVSIAADNVAFVGIGSGDQRGIYLSLGNRIEKVIDLDDALDGKILSNSDFSSIQREALSGDTVAFLAEFADGSEGVFVAKLDTDADGLSDSVEIDIGTDPQDPDTDADALPDGIDPGTIAGVLDTLPANAFRRSNDSFQRRMLRWLANSERRVASSAFQSAAALLETLRRRLDGCDGSVYERPERDDWVIDCTAQRRLQAPLDQMIDNLRL